MSSERAVPAHLCSWVVLQRPDTRVLLARRHQVDYADGLWGLPGGHAARDETWRAAAVRELLEEVGVRVEPAELKPLGISRYLDSGIHGVDAFFLATKWSGEPSAIAECSEVDWFDPTRLPKDVLPWLPTALAVHLKERIWFHETVEGDDSR